MVRGTTKQSGHTGLSPFKPQDLSCSQAELGEVRGRSGSVSSALTCVQPGQHCSGELALHSGSSHIVLDRTNERVGGKEEGVQVENQKGRTQRTAMLHDAGRQVWCHEQHATQAVHICLLQLHVSQTTTSNRMYMFKVLVALACNARVHYERAQA